MSKFIGALLLVAAVAMGFMPMTGVGGPHRSAAASYTGPGDVVASAWVWYGLRGYNASVSTANHPAVNLSRASDSHTCDIDLASSGDLGNTGSCSNSGDNGTAVATWCNATTCSVTKAYDQTQANNCSSATCDVSQATGADQPTVTFSCFNSKPCMVSNGSQYLTGAHVTSLAQPYSYEFTAERTTAASFAAIIGDTATFSNAGWLNAASEGNIYTNVNPNYVVTGFTDSAVHNGQWALNGTTTATVYFDGTNQSGSVGASPGWSGDVQVFNNGAGQIPTGDIAEAGVWPVTFNSTQAGNLCHNQFGYWSGAASC